MANWPRVLYTGRQSQLARGGSGGMRILLMGLALVCITLVSALNVLFSYQIQYIVDALIHKNLPVFIQSILTTVAIMAALLVFEYFRQNLEQIYLNRVGLDIHQKIITKIYNKTYLDFKSQASRDYLYIIQNDIYWIKSYHYSAIIAFLNQRTCLAVKSSASW